MILTLIFIIFFITSMMLMLLNFLISKKKLTDREKSSPFECGFDPYSSPRLPFSIQFYLTSIIFLIFDIEVVIFLPMISSISESNFNTWFFTSFYFIFILIYGLYLEWHEGILTWLK